MTDDILFTFGIEEEFFLVDSETRDVLLDPDPGILAQCEREKGPHGVAQELLQGQIETATRVCATVSGLRQALTETRNMVVRAAEAHGAYAMAAATHPFADWRSQVVTPLPRYVEFEEEMGDIALRSFANGMHIHASFGDPDQRIRVMTAFRRYLPYFIALSASSPFFGGRQTGYRSYRPSLFGAWPRTSIPPSFVSRTEFDALVDMYRQAQVIEDSSQIWFTIRPSHAYPTIELRACDVCTDMNDAVALAALYACTLRRLARLDAEDVLRPLPPTELIAENCWMAQRYGTKSMLCDLRYGGTVYFWRGLDSLVEAVMEDARALGCEEELRQVANICHKGSSAERQLAMFRKALRGGADEREALLAVTNMLIAETLPAPRRALEAAE